MAITRVTNQMMMSRSYASLAIGLSRISKTQEQLTTGKVLNRPSDSPTDTTSAMRMRSSIADQTQYARNADDGLGWLGQADATLTGMLTQVTRARDLGIQGVNALSQSPQAREALAAEVDQLRASLVGGANATYLGRPIFGGVVAGSKAYDASGTFVGVTGSVSRTVALGVKVNVNVDGPTVFGATGSSLFDNLADLSNALRTGNQAGIQTQLGNLQTAQDRITSALSDVGTRENQLERASQGAKDTILTLTGQLSNIEDVDIAKATLDLSMHEVNYKAALSSTARLVQPSLSDFLR